MNKHIPFGKMSKRQKKSVNARYRNGWGVLKPITRRPTNPKAYNRNREKTFDRNENNL